MAKKLTVTARRAILLQMIKEKLLFVLGAQDPEMREIEKVLGTLQIPFVHAAKDNLRCSANLAYSANSVVKVTAAKSQVVILDPTKELVFVETTLSRGNCVKQIDHHNPGDSGYAKSPSQYLEGSSLGQTLSFFGIEPTETQKLLAAADHCLTAAYQGQCPGVDPGELLFMRAAWHSLMSQTTLSNVIDTILTAAKHITKHYNPDTNESVFKDPTRVPHYLAEGAAYTGKPVRYRSLMPNGSLKEMLKGAVPSQIERFMQEHTTQGHQVYGNPHRGYAGAYL